MSETMLLETVHSVALREFRRGRLRGCTPEQAVGWVTTGLLDAGLLAPPPPRTWQAGDPEPDDVRCVVDRSGDLWVRERGKNYEWPWFQAESEIGESWECVIGFHPLTEVRIPGAPS